MSQEQPIRNSESEEISKKVDGGPTDDNAAPKDAAAMQSSGHMKKTRPAPTSGNKSAAIARQILGHHPVSPDGTALGGSVGDGGGITIGEALEATALTAGHRPVDYSDAAAIQAAEVRATGRTNIVPGGVAAAAQSAATRNARVTRDEDKTKLGEVLSDASSKLASDKAVTRRDAEGVIGAELRNDPNLCTRPGGVAASVAAAARLNQSNSQNNNNNNNIYNSNNNNNNKANQNK